MTNGRAPCGAVSSHCSDNFLIIFILIGTESLDVDSFFDLPYPRRTMC
jgi:hypothetical protein